MGKGNDRQTGVCDILFAQHRLLNAPTGVSEGKQGAPGWILENQGMKAMHLGELKVSVLYSHYPCFSAFHREDLTQVMMTSSVSTRISI